MEAFETEVRVRAAPNCELQANNQGVVAGLIMDIRTIKPNGVQWRYSL